jgi:PKD domain
LTVTDSANSSDTDVVTVTVLAAPTVTITRTGPAVAAGVPVTFGVTSSTPATTAFTSYSVSSGMGGAYWASGQGAPPATVTHTFTAPGNYTVTIYAWNDAGGYASGAVVVQVT